MANCMKWVLAILAIIGLVIFAASLAGFFILPDMIATKVKEKLPLRNGSASLQKWAKVSVPIYLKVYIFDIQNALEVETKYAEPIVEERGPYVFFETREKDILSYENGSEIIYYNDHKTFYFRPDLSAGTLDDVVNCVNVPLIGMIEKLRAREKQTLMFGLMMGMINQIIQTSGERVVMKKTVRELLFEGYRVEMFDRVTAFAKGWGINLPPFLPNNTFGVMYGKNGTSPGEFSVNTGINDIMKFAKLESFHGRPSVPHWSGETCNMINGTDGSSFHPQVKRSEVLYIFNTDLCRSLFLNFDRDSEVRGIPTYKFAVPERFFMAPASDPENECFCTHPDGLQHKLCSTDGILDVSRCRKGAPILLSAPHFFMGDPQLRKDVIGLNPEKEEHETFLEIEPMTGLVLNAARRIQININVRNHANFPAVSTVKNVIMPFIWIQESATADEASAQKFKSAIQNKLIIGNALLITGMALGLALCLVCLILLILRTAKTAKFSSKVIESRETKSASYSSLPQKDVPT